MLLVTFRLPQVMTMPRTMPRLSQADRLYGRRRRRTKLRPTAERGYGGAHAAARRSYVAAFRPGQKCAIGGEPLWVHTLRAWCDLLDLAHNADRSGYLGLSCRKHNRGHHDTPPRQWATSRDW